MAATKGHGTPAGYKAGCKSRGGCPARHLISCVDANIRYRSDVAFQRGIDAGLELELILEADAPPVAERPKPKPKPRPKPAPPVAQIVTTLLGDVTSSGDYVLARLEAGPDSLASTPEDARPDPAAAARFSQEFPPDPVDGLLAHFGLAPEARTRHVEQLLADAAAATVPPAALEVEPLVLDLGDPFDGRHLLGCPEGDDCSCPPVAGLIEALTSIPSRDSVASEAARALDQLTRLVLLRENAYTQLLAQNARLLRKAG